jgi:hypothetical protein
MWRVCDLFQVNAFRGQSGYIYQEYIKSNNILTALRHRILSGMTYINLYGNSAYSVRGWVALTKFISRIC